MEKDRQEKATRPLLALAFDGLTRADVAATALRRFASGGGVHVIFETDRLQSGGFVATGGLTRDAVSSDQNSNIDISRAQIPPPPYSPPSSIIPNAAEYLGERARRASLPNAEIEAEMKFHIRFHPDSPIRFKKKAKILKKLCAEYAVAVRLGVAQLLYSRMCGFADWSDYSRNWDIVGASDYDEDASEQTVAVRRHHQIACLTQIGLLPGAADAVYAELRPTGRHYKYSADGRPLDDFWEQFDDAEL